MSYHANVSFVSLRSSLANLPQSAASALLSGNISPQNTIVELTVKNVTGNSKKHIFLGWTGLISSSQPRLKAAGRAADTLELDAAFAQALSLKEGQPVTLTLHANAEYANKVFLEPLEPSDWDVIETNARFVESWMINQVRAIAVDQVVTVYPSSSMISRLKVVSVEPRPAKGFALLSPDSEVIVAPKTAPKMAPKNTQQQGNIPKSTDKPTKKSKRSSGILLRHFVDDQIEKGSQMQQVWVSERLIHTLKASNYAYISVVPFPKPREDDPSVVKDPSDEKPQPCKRVVAYVNYIPDAVFGHVCLSQTVCRALGLESHSFGHMIRLEVPSSKPTKISERVIVHPLKNPDEENLRMGAELTRLSDKESMSLVETLEKLGPLTNNQLISIPLPLKAFQYGCAVQIKSSEWIPKDTRMSVVLGDPWMPSKDHERTSSPNICLSLANDKLKAKTKNKKQSRKPAKLVGIDDILQKYISCVVSSEGGTLIYGSRGCGKSSVLKEICQALNDNLVSTFWFSCGVNSEKSLQYLKDSIKKLFLEAAWYSPSVVIFDDLDKMIRAESDAGAGGGMAGEKSRQLAEYLRSIYEQTSSSRTVTILATSASKQSIHGSLLARHVFEDVFHHQAPDKQIREKILEESVKSQGFEFKGQLVDIVGETEGYQPGDLWTLVEGAVYEAMISDEYNQLYPEHFTRALQSFSPASLRGVKLQKSTTSWDDIGGLKETKAVILETLEWPTKYAPIFANCPLRLRSGLLLYGYPGCGKTLLASAVASQCGLNFISVKGPEILNKYIGASEQSVRDLFDRAQAAKPCVLFFDEFDSLAPKRGHDSTGVTDRVVNQMLTQMDGAEGLDGVYILAATSRPDLIDSALLRPGRLDKSLLCDMPNEHDREEILRTASRKMKLSTEIDLTDIAKKTDGYSGADLHALIYNANLASIQDVLQVQSEEKSNSGNNNINDHGKAGNPDLDTEIVPLQGDISEVEAYEMRQSLAALRVRDSSDKDQSDERQQGNELSDKDSDINSPEIEPRHMEAAMKETKASISTKERLRLRGIYEQFISGRDGSMPNGAASNEIGGRVTLM